MGIRGVDLTGQQFDQMLVLNIVPTKYEKTNTKMWVCRCLCCGLEFEVRSNYLLNGRVKSCLDIENRTVKREFHGLLDTKAYKRWAAMINRCENTKSCLYPNYGGRGITICEEWRYNPQIFCDWFNSFNTPELQIDRIDNDGPYTPENCQLVTNKVNMRN